MNGLKAAIIKLFLHVCALLPLSWARALGRGAVYLYWPFGGRSRKVTERNIQLAFPDLSGQEQAELEQAAAYASATLPPDYAATTVRSRLKN